MWMCVALVKLVTLRKYLLKNQEQITIYLNSNTSFQEKNLSLFLIYLRYFLIHLLIKLQLKFLSFYYSKKFERK